MEHAVAFSIPLDVTVNGKQATSFTFLTLSARRVFLIKRTGWKSTQRGLNHDGRLSSLYEVRNPTKRYRITICAMLMALVP